MINSGSITTNQSLLLSTIDRVFSFTIKEIKDDFTPSSRQITSSLYYLCSAVFLNSESQYCKSLESRNKISALLIKYKLGQNNSLERSDLDSDLIFEYI